LDAFIVALNQTCDGGEKRWYTSTLELQLASLEFCRACRRVPTLHLRINPRTPRSLWSPRNSHTTAVNKRRREVGVWSRVPAVQAFGVTWALSMNDLLQSSAMELRSGSKYRRIGGYSSAASLGATWSLQRLKWLVFQLDAPMSTAWWP
ncbi:unnamed protein product, partial [Ectocarpus sp. 12 AP-2014]